MTRFAMNLKWPWQAACSQITDFHVALSGRLRGTSVKIVDGPQVPILGVHRKHGVTLTIAQVAREAICIEYAVCKTIYIFLL